MRQTNLPEIGMALLRAVEVGDPNHRPMASHHLADRRGCAAVAHDVDHHLIVLENPVPMSPSVDAHRGLVGADDPRTAQPGKDRRNLAVETGLARCNIASSAPSLMCSAYRCWNTCVR